MSLPVPDRRVLIIGASNVTLAFPLLAHACLNSFPGETELFAVHGHGRSFCLRSYVLHRGLPPIPRCGIWEALSQRPAVAQSWALLTDVGNDLIYGLPVDQIAEQVRTTIERVNELGFALTFVRPPLERVLRLTERQYRVTKQLLFPGPTVPWKAISQRVVELDAIVTGFTTGIGGAVVTPELEWYGVDPVHIRPGRRVAAWKKILETWSFPERPDVRWPGWGRAVRTWRQTPDQRWYWRRSYRASQPSLVLPGQGAIWLY